MLGAHATYPNSLKPGWLKAVKLRKRQVLVAGILLLVLVGGWWTYQSGWLSQWLPLGTPVTAASGQIVIQQAQPAGLVAETAVETAAVQTQNGPTIPAAVSANTTAAASATITTAAITTAAGETVSAEAATATATTEPVSLAGVAGVNGALIWDDAGNLLAALDSGALVTVQASAGNGAWLSVQTAAGAGWTPASSVIAYGLGRLSSIPLPDAVIAAANTSIAAEMGADTAAASTDGETETAPAVTAADAGAQGVNAASLIAQVTGAGTRLNIRSGPGTDYGVTTQAEEGATYMAVGRNAAGDWLLLQLSDGSTGWASASFLALSGDLQVLPVVDAAA